MDVQLNFGPEDFRKLPVEIQRDFVKALESALNIIKAGTSFDDEKDRTFVVSEGSVTIEIKSRGRRFEMAISAEVRKSELD